LEEASAPMTAAKVQWRVRNPAAVNEHKRRWREKNPAPAREREAGRRAAQVSNQKRKAEIRAFVDGLKSVPCADCKGTFDPICMDFDHLPGHVKTRNVSVLKDLDLIKAEVLKCEVVCANCHRLRTKSRHQFGRPADAPPKSAPHSPQLSLLDE